MHVAGRQSCMYCGWHACVFDSRHAWQQNENLIQQHHHFNLLVTQSNPTTFFFALISGYLSFLSFSPNYFVVLLWLSRLFWKSRRAEKARRWFNLAIKLNPKLGEAWAAYFAFELLEGDDAKRKDVIQRCVNAEPNGGAQWNRIVKRPKNWRLSIPEKLKAVVEEFYPNCLTETAQKTPVGQGTWKSSGTM